MNTIYMPQYAPNILGNLRLGILTRHVDPNCIRKLYRNYMLRCRVCVLFVSWDQHGDATWACLGKTRIALYCFPTCDPLEFFDSCSTETICIYPKIYNWTLKLKCCIYTDSSSIIEINFMKNVKYYILGSYAREGKSGMGVSHIERSNFTDDRDGERQQWFKYECELLKCH